MKSKILFMALLSVLLTSCSNTENKEQNNTTTKITTNPFDTVVTTTVLGDNNGSTEDNQNSEITEVPVPYFNFDFVDYVKSSDTYDGEAIEFEMSVTTSGVDVDCMVGILCDGKIIPTSVNGGEFENETFVSLSGDKNAENTIKFSYIPSGRKGDTVKISPFFITYLNCPDVNEYGIKNYFYAGGPYIIGGGNKEVFLNADGIASETQNSHKIENVPIAQQALENTIQLDENGNTSYAAYEKASVQLFDGENYKFKFDYLEKDENNIVSFDLVMLGKPETYNIMCWSDKGFLPAFDGNYSLELATSDVDNMSVYKLNIDLTDYEDVTAIKICAFDKDANCQEYGAMSIFDKQKADEYKSWLQSVE